MAGRRGVWVRDEAGGAASTLAHQGLRVHWPRLPPFWLGLALLIFVAPLLSNWSPLIDAETGAAAGDVALRLPASYVLLAPAMALLDNLSLLTVRQHAALAATVLLCVLLVVRPWRTSAGSIAPGTPPDATRSRGTAAPSGRGMRATRRTLGTLSAAVAGLATLYAAATLAPRPMARLAVLGAGAEDVVAVDFHSHTQASHDGRRGFSAAANRDWHRATGFDVAYITDHGRVDTAVAAMAYNPAQARDGTVLLPGVEVVYDGEHVIGLGVGARTAIARTGEPPSADTRARTGPVVWPVVVHTIPERLARVAMRTAAGDGGAAAIELTDACPRGMEQARRDRARILRIADSLDLAVVSASNDHGWSRTAAAWSLLHIAGWRAMSPAVLDSAIQGTITRHRRHAVRVVLRRPVPGASSPLGLALTGPELLWTTLAMQTFAGRVASTLWLALIVVLRARQARLRAAVAVPRSEAAGPTLPALDQARVM